MVTVRNIEKRRELQQLVYNGYGHLTEEELHELDNEVGAAFRGYETAMKDFIQLIVDGKSIEDIKVFVCEQLNGKATKHIFRFSEIPNTQMLNYLRTTVKEELIRKRCNKDDAETYIDTFINYPETRQDLIDEWELDSIRICEHCGTPMCEGYLVNDFDTYCSEECARAATTEMGWTKEVFDKHLANADNEDSCIYWTQWEG